MLYSDVSRNARLVCSVDCSIGMLSCFSCVWVFPTLWTVVHQGPLSMGFSSQEYWSGLPCPPLGGLPDPGIKYVSIMSPALAGGFFTTTTTWEGGNSLGILASSGREFIELWRASQGSCTITSTTLFFLEKYRKYSKLTEWKRGKKLAIIPTICSQDRTWPNVPYSHPIYVKIWVYSLTH